MKKIDLHTHSYFSDGIFSPAKLIKRAVKNGLSGLSITDHDNTEAIAPAYSLIHKNYPDLFFLPGVEFSTIHPSLGEVHILGYFPGNSYQNLNTLIKTSRSKRWDRLTKIVECIRKQGFDLSLEDFPEDKSKSWGRMHVARALVKKNYFDDTQATFNRLLKKGKVCYIPRDDISTLDIFQKIMTYGGFPVVAHPGFLYQRSNWVYLEEMIRIGLKGIEVDHPMISPNLKNIILRDTASQDLIYTGGSDFHGDLNRGDIGNHTCSLNAILEFIKKMN